MDGAIAKLPLFAGVEASAALRELNAREATYAAGETLLRAGELGPINRLLEERIWRRGALYPPRELMSRALGGPLDLSFYASYLSDKLSEVYGE